MADNSSSEGETCSGSSEVLTPPCGMPPDGLSRLHVITGSLSRLRVDVAAELNRQGYMKPGDPAEAISQLLALDEALMRLDWLMTLWLDRNTKTGGMPFESTPDSESSQTI